MSKQRSGADQAPTKKKKKGTSPALVKARKERDDAKKARTAASKRATEAKKELAAHLAGRALRFGAGMGAGALAGAVTEGLKGSALGAVPEPGEEPGFFDTDLKAALVPAGLGLGIAVLGGGSPLMDSIGMGMAATLASELGREGVRKLREPDEE